MNDQRLLDVAWRAAAHWATGFSRRVVVPVSGFLTRWGAVVILLLTALTLGFGALGFQIQNSTLSPHRSTSQIWYSAAQLLVLQTGGDDADNWSLFLARLFAVAFVVVAGGAVLTISLRDSFSGLRLALSWDHVVICGAGRIGMQLLEDITREFPLKRVVVIELNERNEHLKRCRELGGIVLLGDASDAELLARSGVARADEVFVVTGSDSDNLEIALAVGEIVRRSRAATSCIKCHVHLLDLQLARLFQDHPVVQDGDDRVEMRMFNAFLNAAQHLEIDYLADDDRRPREEQVAHYLLFGFDDLGQSIASAIAHQAHYENGNRSRLSIVYEHERQKCGFLKRYPRFAPENLDVAALPKCCDQWQDNRKWLVPLESRDGSPPARTPVEYVCNAEFVSFEKIWHDVENIDQADRCVQLFGAERIVPHVIFCFGDDRKNLDCAVRFKAKLLRLARRRELSGKRIGVFVGLPTQSGLSELLKREPQSYGGSGPPSVSIELVAFGRCDRTCNYGTVTQPETEILAMKLHERYRDIRKAEGKPLPDSAREWARLGEEFRVSNRRAATHALVKLRMFGDYSIKRDDQHSTAADPRLMITLGNKPLTADQLRTLADKWRAKEEILAKAEHNRFVAERLLGGWQYNNQTLRDQLLNNTLVPWEELTPEEKSFDFSQVRMVAEVLGIPAREPQPTT